MTQPVTFKIPRLYKAAAKVAFTVKEEDGNLEQLSEEYKKKTNTKALAALVSKTLNNEDLLNKIIENSQILKKEPNADPWLFRILITELLLGKQRLPVGCKPIQTVLAYGPSLKTEFLRAKGKLSDKSKKSDLVLEDVNEGDIGLHETVSKSSEAVGLNNVKLTKTVKSKAEWGDEQDYITLEGEEDPKTTLTSKKRHKNKRKKSEHDFETYKDEVKETEQRLYKNTGNESLTVHDKSRIKKVKKTHKQQYFDN